jgi:hypothetical protein
MNQGKRENTHSEHVFEELLAEAGALARLVHIKVEGAERRNVHEPVAGVLKEPKNARLL